MGEQERCRVGKLNFGRAYDLSLIKHHAVIETNGIHGKNVVYIVLSALTGSFKIFLKDVGSFSPTFGWLQIHVMQSLYQNE